MIVVGAKGHAVEILEILTRLNRLDNLYFFDDISKDIGDCLYKKFRIIRSTDEAKRILQDDKRFILGLGNPEKRYQAALKFNNMGGILSSIISSDTLVGNWNCTIGHGVNIMTNVFISNDTTIGEGSLINTKSNIHHGTEIGKYVEICPSVTIAGKCTIDDFCFIGTGAVVLPGIHIGKHVIVGAGSVVTKNIDSHTTVLGIPARQKKH